MKKIRLYELEDLGYKPTKQKVTLGNKPHKYVILELKNENGGKEVGFCYLFSTKQLTGVILPNPFRHYLYDTYENLKKLVDEGFN